MAEIPRKHFLFLNYPAFGHIIPLLELAKKTSQYHQVTFAVSATVLAEMRKRELIPSSEPRKNEIVFVGIEDSFQLDYVSKSASATGIERINKTTADIGPALKHLLRTMPVHGSSLVQFTDISSIKEPVDAVVAERFILPIALPVCHELGVPYVVFNACAWGLMAADLDITEDTPAIPDNEVPDGSPDRTLTESLKRFFLNVSSQLNLASAIVLNTFDKSDRRVAGVDVLSVHLRTRHIPVFCVGPIFPSAEKKTESDGDAVVNAKVAKWLDMQNLHSVVYISFGSLGPRAALTLEQTEIMGKALLAMKKPFIYSIPESLQVGLPQEIRDQIASSHQSSNGTDSPFLVLPWVPQKAILTHPSTGIFLTHAGWNSTMESIVGGVPMVIWPMFADQQENAAWIVANGLGVLIPGTAVGGRGRLVPMDEICAALTEAETCRPKSAEMAKAAEDALADAGSSKRDFMRLMRLDFTHKAND